MKNSDILKNNFNLRPIRSNYLVNLSEKYKFIYAETPKVACSTIKKTLQLIEVEGDESKIVGNTHNKDKSPLLSPSEIGPTVLRNFLHKDDVLRFTFVRNPFSRILSAYLDKIVTNDWEKKRHLPKLGFDPNDEVEFIDFLKVIVEQAPIDMDIHWCPQTILVNYPKIRYHFVGKFENFSNDFNRVLTKISAMNDIPLKPIKSVKNHSVGANEKLLKYYDGPTIDLVRKKYRLDFQHFFYFPDPYFG